jgi:predicted ArsR family transcriptional regulator
VLDRHAFARGRALAPDAGAGGDAVLRVLEDHGFEPRVDDGGIALVNCPFHVLARDHTELVCGMNLRLIEGVLDGVRAAGLTARLRPAAGNCCVRLEPTPADDDSGG